MEIGRGAVIRFLDEPVEEKKVLTATELSVFWEGGGFMRRASLEGLMADGRASILVRGEAAPQTRTAKPRTSRRKLKASEASRAKAEAWLKGKGYGARTIAVLCGPLAMYIEEFATDAPATGGGE